MIFAVEQKGEPMSDLIRKQDALDALGEEPLVWYGDWDEIAERNQWRRAVKAIKAAPSARPEPLTNIDDALALLDAIRSSGRMDYSDYCALHDAISSISAQPEIHFDEWCTDCKEYDHEKHCCPRFNKVIRRTVAEIKAEQRSIVQIAEVTCKGR